LGAEDNIERALGVLIGKLETIERRLDRQDESRHALHKRLNDLVLRTTYVEKDLSSVRHHVDRVECVTDDVRALRQQAQGAGTLGQWLIRFGIGLVALAGWLMGIFTWLTGRPPP
jgi:hypothetical protein